MLRISCEAVRHDAFRESTKAANISKSLRTENRMIVLEGDREQTEHTKIGAHLACSRMAFQNSRQDVI